MLNKTRFFKIWCIFFWSVFAIQIFPMVFGGTVNVLAYVAILFLFLYFTQFHLHFDAWFCLGLMIYAMESIFVLDESSKISFMSITMNYTVWKMCFWITGILCALMFIQNTSVQNAVTFKRYLLPIIGVNAIANLIIVTFINPNASRYMSYAGTNLYSMIIGTSDFDMVYSTALLCPCFLYLYKKSTGKNKIKYLIFNLIIFVYIITASFFIAILVMLLGIASFWFVSIKNKRIKYLLVILGFFVLGSMLININLFYEICLLIASKINNRNISTRIIELVSVFRDGGEMVDAVARLDIYIKIFKGFVKHPFLGCILTEQELYTNFAGHSTILDILCGYGLIGSIPLFAGFHRMIRHQKRKLTDVGKRVFNCCYVAFLFMALFNPVTNGYLVLGTIMVVPTILLISEGESWKR